MQLIRFGQSLCDVASTQGHLEMTGDHRPLVHLTLLVLLCPDATSKEAVYSYSRHSQRQSKVMAYTGNESFSPGHMAPLKAAESN